MHKLTIPYTLLLLVKYKYLILFPILIIEGPVVTILAAFLASPAGGQYLEIVPVFFIVFFADITGDTLYYLIGKYAKNYFINRFPKRFSLDPVRSNKIERYYKEHGVKTIMLGKISHGLGWPVMVGAGSAGMPYKTFITMNTLVSIPKSLILVAAGYYYGVHYDTLVQYIGKAGMILTTVTALIFLYIIYRRYTKINLA